MSESISFTELSLPLPILKSLQEMGYENPTPIQAEAIPFLMDKNDLIGQAQTGTGKTAAFALPLLCNLEIERRSPQVLVLTPTRELAIQVSEAFQTYGKHLKGLRVLPVYGGQGYTTQLQNLKRGVHVIVGTPGRLLDHLDRGTLKLDGLKAVVLDEADEMLRMGFIDDVERIVSKAPESCQMAMFSATMPAPIKRITKRYLKDPREVKIASKTATVEQTDQRYLLLKSNQKPLALARVLEAETYDGVLVFVRTKSATVTVANHLDNAGFAVSALNGDMSQNLREQTVKNLKNGRLNVIVATDVAARGLDVDRISLVINYDIPQDTEYYIHRIGRTGRAGREGKAILFINSREKRLLRDIEKATNRKIEPSKLPTNEELEQKRASLFQERVVDTFSRQPMDFYYKYLDQMKQDMNMSLEDLAAALLFLAQKDMPLKVEEILVAPESTRKSRDRKNKGKDRHSRADRFGEPQAESSQKPKNGKKRKTIPNVKFSCYRLEVGKRHQARVTDIVGAIANEANIDSQYIGHIKLYDDYSTVELPDGMPKEIFKLLGNVYIRQRRMKLSLVRN